MSAFTDEEAQQARTGTRAALPLAASSEDAAAEQLLSADRMLEANPNLQVAKCSKVEVGAIALLLMALFNNST
jgi:hypothetical protein